MTAGVGVDVVAGHLRGQAEEKVEEAGRFAAVDGAGQGHHFLGGLGQVVHGVALVAVDAFILVDFIDYQQIQPAFGPFLEVAGQRRLGVAVPVAGQGAGQAQGLTAVGQSRPDSPLSLGIQLEAAPLLALAAAAGELVEG